jgi:histidine triad (HIT) family protein
MTKYDSKTKEGKCIFCGIIEGSINTPGMFWEDDNFMAFLSTYPNTEGFTVVVPKKHYGSDVLAMPDEIFGEFVLAAKKVSVILEKYFADVGRVGLIMEGTGIDHAHIKLFPMHGTEHLRTGEWKQHFSKNDTYFEKYLGYISSNDGPKGDEKKIKELAERLRKVN